MRRVRQRILPEQDTSRPQNFAYGGIAAQMPRLCQEF